MRVELYGLAFETPTVTFYLWSPWRSTALEHRLFEAVRALPGTVFETQPDELRVHVQDPKAWRAAVQAVSRVLKGWQEEASDAGGEERRSWRWMVEADVDASGYDHTGAPSSVWGFIRLSLDRDSPGQQERGEDVDLDGFGVRLAGATDGRR
jgi:hypothetical protein